MDLTRFPQGVPWADWAEPLIIYRHRHMFMISLEPVFNPDKLARRPCGWDWVAWFRCESS